MKSVQRGIGFPHANRQGRRRSKGSGGWWIKVTYVQRVALVVCCSIILQYASIAQDAVRNKKLTVSFAKDERLLDAIEKIRNNGQVNFAYQVSEVEQLRLGESFVFNGAKVDDVLSSILNKTPFQYIIKDEVVIITRGRAEQLNNSKSNVNIRVRGNVSSSQGTPLEGVSIVSKNAGVATVSGNNGNFEIANIPAGSALEFSHVEYVARSLSAAETMNVVLEAAVGTLEDVVVTALGIQRERKKLGYAAQEIKGEMLDVAKETNMLKGLQGKVAGLNMTQSPTGINGSVRIVLRGESSLDLRKNDALIVVDGVPINNTNQGIGGSAYAATDLPVDYGTGAAEINPEDIESISVLKGPNAAALYGSRAANGVIVIKTKRAAASKRLGVSVSSSFTTESVLRLPDFQNAYGGGTGVGLKYYSYGTGPDGSSTSNSGHNWGAPFAGQSFVQFGSPLDENGQRTRIPWVPHPDNVADFYQNGNTFINNISLHKTGEMGDFRISYNKLDQTGIMPNTELHRHTVNLNAGIRIAPKLQFRSNINYVNSNSDNLPIVGYGSGSPTYTFIWYERNADDRWFHDYWTKGKEGIQQQFYFTWADNPYMVMYEHLNAFKRNRVFGNVHLDYTIAENLTLMLRTGIDYSGDIRTSRRPFSTVISPRGLYRRQDYTYFERNSDFLLSYARPLSSRLRFSANFGGNNLQINKSDNIVTTRELLLPKVYNLGNASSRPETRQFDSEKIVNSLYFFSELEYNNYLFLQMTGRNDWSSTLPKSNNSYFYPSVSLSAVMSDIFSLKSNTLHFWKLRASYASVGNDTDPYNTDQYYNYSDLPGSVVNASTIANADLKPEITSSAEFGTELSLLGNRLSVDFTYYNTISRNQILRVPLAVSSGFDAKVLNAGKIRNYGVEAVVKFTPINRKFRWMVILNGSANRSRIISLSEGISNYIIANGPVGTVEAREGGRMGDIYGVGHLRNDEGQIIYKNGTPQRTTKTINVGNYNPDFIGGVLNSFRLGDFSLSVLFDGRYGGKMYSLTHGTGTEAGSLSNTLPGREDGLIGEGVTMGTDGKYVANTVRVPAYTYYRDHYNRANVESNTFDASFIKLREVVLTYTLPARYVRNLPIESCQVNLTGRNLLLFTRMPHIDPETSHVNGGSIIPGFETAQMPSTKSYGINLQFSF